MFYQDTTLSLPMPNSVKFNRPKIKSRSLRGKQCVLTFTLNTQKAVIFLKNFYICYKQGFFFLFFELMLSISRSIRT